jgi:hypothetical protein
MQAAPRAAWRPPITRLNWSDAPSRSGFSAGRREFA